MLTATLTRLAPSPRFVIPPGTNPWISTSDKPDPEQLFADLGGVVDISVTSAGAVPLTTKDEQGHVRTDDPTIDLQKTGRWYRLPAAGGTWRIYTIDLGADEVPVSVLACPDR